MAVRPSDAEVRRKAVPGRRREQNKEDTRRRIIAAGRKLFAAQGFEATTTGALALEAGIGAGTFYNYLRGKEDLLVAVFKEDVGRAWSEAFEAVCPEDDLLDQVFALFAHVGRFHELEPELSRAFFRDLHFVSPTVSAEVGAFMAHIYDRLEQVLADAQARGALAPDVPRGPLARNLFALWHQLMQRRHGGAADVEQVLVRLRRAFEVALWTMVPDKP